MNSVRTSEASYRGPPFYEEQPDTSFTPASITMSIEIQNNYISLSTAWGFLCPHVWAELIAHTEWAGSDGAYEYFRGDPGVLAQLKAEFFS